MCFFLLARAKTDWCNVVWSSPIHPCVLPKASSLTINLWIWTRSHIIIDLAHWYEYSLNPITLSTMSETQTAWLVGSPTIIRNQDHRVRWPWPDAWLVTCTALARPACQHTAKAPFSTICLHAWRRTRREGRISTRLGAREPGASAACNQSPPKWQSPKKRGKFLHNCVANLCERVVTPAGTAATSQSHQTLTFEVSSCKKKTEMYVYEKKVQITHQTYEQCSYNSLKSFLVNFTTPLLWVCQIYPITKFIFF